jgi:hypothetical protein
MRWVLIQGFALGRPGVLCKWLPGNPYAQVSQCWAKVNITSLRKDQIHFDHRSRFNISKTPMYWIPQLKNPKTNPFHPSYPQLLTLALSYHYRFSWNQSLILSRKHPSLGLFNFFKVQDTAVNSIYASGWFILANLSSTFSPSLAASCLAHAQHASKGIQNVLFDQQLGRYVTGYHDRDDQRVFSKVHTIQSLFPLLLPDLPAEHVRGIVESITDPSIFGTKFPLPSVSRSEESYNPVQDSDLLWRGPVWGFPNWFVMEGLELHGQTEVRDRLMERWEKMVRENGVWENYNPETGTGYGAEGLGMTCAVVDWMVRLGRI